MPNSPERQLFESAKSYYTGATVLMKPPDLPGVPAHLTQPAVTCAELSLKLFLKCLLSVTNRDGEDTIYRIADLFKSLDAAAKKSVLDKFDEFSNSSLSEAELVKHLDALDDAFDQWRYIRVDDARNVNLEDLEEMILAVKAAIMSIKPEWE